MLPNGVSRVYGKTNTQQMNVNTFQKQNHNLWVTFLIFPPRFQHHLTGVRHTVL